MSVDVEIESVKQRLLGRRVRYRAGTPLAGLPPEASNLIVHVYREQDDGELGNRTGGTVWAVYEDGEQGIADWLEPLP